MIKYPEPQGRLIYTRQPIKILYNGTMVEAFLTLSETPEPINATDKGELDKRQYRRHSLIMQSNRTAFEIFDSPTCRRPPTSVHLPRLFGTIDVPELNNLIRSMDQGSSHELIIAPDRTGLLRSQNSFGSALDAAVDEALRPHIERMERETQSAGTDAATPETRRLLGSLANVLGNYVREETDDEETESEGGDEHGEENAGLHLIPRQPLIEPDQPGSIALLYRGDDMDDELEAMITQTEPGQQDDVALVPLQPRQRGVGHTIALKARPAGAALTVRAEFAGRTATARARWEHRDRPTITQLQWERANYGVNEGGQRHLRLLAPLSFLDAEVRLEVAGSGARVSAAANEFRWDNTRQCLVFSIRALGAVQDTRTTVTAFVLNQSAETTVQVRSPAEKGGLSIELSERFSTDHDRAWYEPVSSTLIVNANHPDVARYLGNRADNRPGQQSLPFRTLLRELACHAIVTYTLTRRRQEPVEPSELLREYERGVNKLIGRTRRLLVADAAKSAQST